MTLLISFVYLNLSYALTNASSAPIPRIASQFRIMQMNGRQMLHEGVNEVPSANMKMYAAKAM